MPRKYVHTCIDIVDYLSVRLGMRGLGDAVINNIIRYSTSVRKFTVNRTYVIAVTYYTLINNYTTDLKLSELIELADSDNCRQLVSYRTVKKMLKKIANTLGGKYKLSIRDIAVAVCRRLNLSAEETEDIIKLAEELKTKFPSISDRMLVAYAISVKTRYTKKKIAEASRVAITTLRTTIPDINRRLNNSD